ncbi:hypothetical protein MKW98_022642, partial [Papaver atlanticum]
MTENEREQICEKWRTSYQMQRTRVGDATNNQRRAGTSSGNEQISMSTQSFELRRSPRFFQQTQEQQLEQRLIKETAKGKSVTEIEDGQICDERHIAYNRSMISIRNAVRNDREVGTDSDNRRNTKRPLEMDQLLEHRIKDKGKRVRNGSNNDQEAGTSS